MFMSDTKQYSGWRANLWPIAAYELKKVIPMSLLLFCMLYDYTSVRLLKDTLVVNAKGGGEIVLPFLKFFVVLPSALLFVGMYAKLNSKYSKTTVFYMISAFFAAFFLLFGNVLYPMKDILHLDPDRLVELQSIYPRLGQALAACGLWTYSIFYVFAELWGSVGITVLFWQFANQITPTADSKRHYVSYQSIANVALPLSAWSISYLFNQSGFDKVKSVAVSCNIVVALTVCAMLLYYYINNHVLTDPRFPVPDTKVKVKKTKPGLVESLKVVLASRYLIYIAFLVIAYGVTINFSEVVWKGMLKKHAAAEALAKGVSAEAIYTSLQSNAFFWTGIAAIVLATFGKGIVSRFGWRITAMITPIGMLISSLLFFGVALMPSAVAGFATSLNMSLIGFGVFIGTLQQVFTKSAKYILFDTTKEMAYIPLSETDKVQGKAAVEVIGGRAGKSGASLVQNVMLAMFAAKDIFVITPYIAVCSIIVVILWFMIVNVLAVEYNKRIQQEYVHPAK